MNKKIYSTKFFKETTQEISLFEQTMKTVSLQKTYNIVHCGYSIFKISCMFSRQFYWQRNTTYATAYVKMCVVWNTFNCDWLFFKATCCMDHHTCHIILKTDLI